MLTPNDGPVKEDRIARVKPTIGYRVAVISRGRRVWWDGSERLNPKINAPSRQRDTALGIGKNCVRGHALLDPNATSGSTVPNCHQPCSMTKARDLNFDRIKTVSLLDCARWCNSNCGAKPSFRPRSSVTNRSRHRYSDVVWRARGISTFGAIPAPGNIECRTGSGDSGVGCAGDGPLVDAMGRGPRGCRISRSYQGSRAYLVPRRTLAGDPGAHFGGRVASPARRLVHSRPRVARNSFCANGRVHFRDNFGFDTTIAVVSGGRRRRKCGRDRRLWYDARPLAHVGLRSGGRLPFCGKCRNRLR